MNLTFRNSRISTFQTCHEMLSFLKQKLSGDVTEGVRIAVAENVTDGWSQDVASVAEDLRLDIYDHIRSIRDPEKPQNLEELNVVVESLVHVYPINGAGDKFVAQIEFVPTVPHCHLATLIGLCIRTKLERVLVPGTVKLDILVREGSHSTEADVNKQINDKERVAAAMENPNLKETVEECIKEEE